MSIATRISRLREAMEHEQVNVSIVTHGPNVRWLTGYGGMNGRVVVSATQAWLVTDSRYSSFILPDSDALKLDTSNNVVERVASASTSSDDRVAIEADTLPHATATRLFQELLELGREPVLEASCVTPLRAIKDQQEQRAVRAAAEATVALFAHLVESTRIGETERELSRRINAWFHLHADGPSFEPIVAFGANGGVPHHRVSDRELGPGDGIIVDCGAVVDGYCADMTRTFSAGEPSAWFAETHEIVLQATDAVRAGLIPGLDGRAADALARDLFEAQGRADAFTTGMGHGVGLEIHEAPMLVPRSAATVAVGNTLAIEPGLYDPARGGVRIEDTVLLNEDGVEVLTHFSRDLIAV